MLVNDLEETQVVLTSDWTLEKEKQYNFQIQLKGL